MLPIHLDTNPEERVTLYYYSDCKALGLSAVGGVVELEIPDSLIASVASNNKYLPLSSRTLLSHSL